MDHGRTEGACLVLALTIACGASASELPIARDESLTLDQYVQLGFPELGVDWSSDERATVRTLLRDLAGQRPTQLPRFASERSGALFQKLISEEFFRRTAAEGAIGRLTGSELEQLSADELARAIDSDSLPGIYSPKSTGLVFDRELVEFAAQQLAQAVRIRGDMEESLARLESEPTLGAHGEDFVNRYSSQLEDSDPIVVQSFLQLVSAAVAERFTREARAEAAAHLVKQIPQIAPTLSPEARSDLREVLRGASATPGADPQLEALLQSL